MRAPLFLSAVIGAALAASASMAHAQPPQPAVSVSIGPALQKKADDYGVEELSYLAGDLRKTVQRAAAKAGPNVPSRVDLVLEDAIPNRPTSAQLGRNVDLSLNSIGLGGARISGMVTYADGTQQPLREQFFQTDLYDDRGADTWYDAEHTIDQVAYDVRRNKYPTKYSGPGPTGNGHFGYPYDAYNHPN